MGTRDKKARSMRGHTFMGHGRVGKHRKHPGGRGLAGGQHHHRTLMDRFHPGYFGKVGMRHFHLKKNPGFVESINVDKLWHLARKVAGADILDKAKAAGGKALVLDVNAQGITKVLGKGLIPELPIIIKARYVSKLAEEKIRAAGGAVILTA